MPATKALFWVALLGIGAAFLVFLFVKDLRPPIVKAWFRAAQGLTPAQTPTEAMEKFREAIRKRDYESAALYTGGDYREYMTGCANAANKLGTSIDELVHNVDEVAHINSDIGKGVLSLMEPFPKDFVFDMEKLKSKSNNETVWAVMAAPAGKTFEAKGPNQIWKVDLRILRSLVPDPWDGTVEIKQDGNAKDQGWRIYFPVSAVFRSKADYLKQNYGNYMRALDNIKYSIKHDAATKSDFERQLQKELEDAK